MTQFQGHLAKAVTDQYGEGFGRIIVPSCLIPEGQYDVRYCHYETQICFGGPKVVVHFLVDKHDIYDGSPLARYYNVLRLDGSPRKYGNFDIGSSNCDLVREYRRLVKQPARSDRISFAPLKDKQIGARVRTVTSNSRRQPLSDNEQYSVIAELVRIIREE